MNLRGNLQDIQCNILHTFIRTFLVLRKVHSPYWPCSFLRNIFTPGPGDVLWNWPFFSNAATLQSRLSDPSKYRLQEKCLLLTVLQQLEVCPKKVCDKIIWLTKRFYEIHFIHFSGMLEKLLSWKFWKIIIIKIRKTSLVAFLLKNLSYTIYPPITTAKTDSTASVSFACS